MDSERAESTDLFEPLADSDGALALLLKMAKADHPDWNDSENPGGCYNCYAIQVAENVLAKRQRKGLDDG